MSSRSFGRSFRTPRGYQQDPGGRINLLNQAYIGYVKNNQDAFKLGRLQVWIPELSSNPDDELSWLTVQYCSPFAGATNPKSNTKQGKKLADTQQSYGWWAVPPDLENEVVVMFINGDPNRGIYIGGLYQSFMNHMVPGIPTNNSYDPGVDGANPPVAEYNRWDPNVPNSDNHTRARFDPLHDGLQAQGLYEDTSRGPTDAGARRDEISNVYGFKSPGGHQLVFDDGNDSSIRIRTKTGAQVYINDATGYVYFISGNGNSWLEVSDDGIDAYSAKSISLRSQGDLNLHADGQINMNAIKSWNAYGAGGGSMQFGKNLEVLTGAACNISAAGDMNLLSKGAANITSSGNMSTKAGGTIALESGGVCGITAGGNLFLKGAQIQQNGGNGPTATKAAEAQGPKPTRLADRDLDPSAGYPDSSTMSICSRMPTHEPYNGHPGTKSPAASMASSSDSSSSSGGEGTDSVEEEGQGGEVDDTQPAVIPDDGTKFCCPVSGVGGSPFGYRIHPVLKVKKMHTGVDIRSTPVGTPIYASKAGTVTFAGTKGGYGNCTIVDHGNGMSTLYAHQSAILVKKGQTVTQMQQIGKVGATGRVTGPHLHFEVRQGGSPINPAQVIPFATGKAMKAGDQK